MTHITYAPIASFLAESAGERRSSPLLDAADGRQGPLSRPAAQGRRGFPGPASRGAQFGAPLYAPHCTPVPTPAQSSDRAIRVRRSPR